MIGFLLVLSGSGSAQRLSDFSVVCAVFLAASMCFLFSEADCLPGPESEQMLRHPPQHLRRHASQRLPGSADQR